MRFTTPLICILVALPGPRVAGQEVPHVALGDRVRLSAPAIAPDPIVGTVISRGADTLTLAVVDRETPLGVPLGGVQSLDVSRGKHSHALAGLGIGVGFGLILGAIEGANSQDNYLCSDSGTCAAFGAVSWGLTGLLIGALVRSEQWERVPLGRMSVRSANAGRGVALGVAVSF